MSDTPHDMPDAWAWSGMSEACEKIQDGTHFSPDQEKQLCQGKYPYVTAKNVRPYGLDLSDITYLEEEDHRQIYERCDASTGDVLLVKDGVNTGDAAINTVEGEISLLSSVCMLRPRKELLLNQFLRYFLLSPQGRRSLTGQMTGTAIKRIILRKIRDTPVPVAPMNEQRRIVAEIEELFSDLDAGVAALERIRANLKRYRAAVLKAAVEGKLTAEWRAKHPRIEPASKLLERILTERRQNWEQDQLARFAAAAGKTPPKGWREKYVEPAAPDTSELPELPQGWCWASVDQISIVVRGASPRPAGDPRFFGGPVPWITVGALTADENPYLRGVSEGLTEAGREASRYIQPDTLLLTNSGATLGVPKITLIGGCINDGSVALFHLNSPLKLFLYYFLKTQTRKLRAINQGAAQPNLNTGIVKAIVVPIPPLLEQQQILGEIERKLSVVEENETLAIVNLKRAARLRQSILKRAFEGRLVPQDPTDEPAEKLLERIRQERAVANGDAQSSTRRERTSSQHRNRRRPGAAS